MKPLFIPLKSAFYEAFERGEKTVEYRRYSARWCAASCWPGREVVLSKGYGKRNRLRGVITMFCADGNPTALPGWTECYGDAPGQWAACITIEVLR